MAVIRQQRQNITKPIGVIRSDTGLSEQWASVGRLADTMIESSFNELKREAREKGIETAQAASAANIRTIDPITGEPEAFNIPSGFGVEARTAYQDIIERRYVSQTEQDFSAEAQRLAILYQNDSNGVAKFKTDFGTYIENAKGTAVPKFANIIENIGSAMLASNSLNLMSKQSQKQHEENRQQIELDVNDLANKIESLIGLGDSKSLEDARNASFLAEELIEKNVDGDVQFISNAEAKKLRRTVSLAKARGATRRINQIILDNEDLESGDINDLQIVLQTGNVENISTLPESLQDVASELMSNEDFNTHFDAINTDLRGIQANLGQSEADERMRQTDIDQEEKQKEDDEKVQLKLGIKPEAQKVNDTLDKHIKSSDLFAAQDTLNAWFGKLDSIAQKLESDIDTTTAKKRTRQLLFDRLIKDVNGVTDLEEATDFRDYIDNEGDLKVDLPDDVQAIADFIIKNAEFDVDRDSIGADTQAIVTAKRAVINQNSLSASKQNIRESFINSIGSPTTKSHQNEMEEIILNGRPSSFFLTADAINTQEQWKPKVLASGGVIPSTPVGIVKSAISGMVDDPARINLAVSYFGMFSSVRVKGSTQEKNLWQNVLSAEEFSAFEETLYAASMSENGINDFPKIAATLSDAVNNESKYQEKVKKVLDEGETLEGLLQGIVGTNNANVFLEMNSYLKYKIASGNKDKDTIISDMTRYYEQHYHDTQGVVIDPAFGPVGKSRQALSGVFGDNVLPAVNYLNKVVADLGIKDARFGLSYKALAREQLMPRDTYQNVIEEEIGTEDIQTVKGKTRLQLQPMRYSGTVAENVQYMAVVLDKDGGLEPFTYTYVDDKGRTVTDFLYVYLDDIKRGVAR
jgi:hypothetical protein